MMHVWQVPVPGGPLTMDPTDQQMVEAAIMAQQDGQAPVTPGAKVPSLNRAFGTEQMTLVPVAGGPFTADLVRGGQRR